MTQINLQSAGRQHIFRIITLGALALSLFSPMHVTPAYAIDAPTPITPADNITVTATENSGSLAMPPTAIPEFSWTAVGGATRYRLEISADIAFTIKKQYTTPLTRFTPPNVADFADNTLYYWRVMVEAPEASQPSPIRSFTRQWATTNNFPELNKPLDGEVVEFFEAPTFTWGPVMGAARYRFQISATPDFTTLAVDLYTLAYSIQPLTKLANGFYYWRVLPYNPANQQGTPSETRGFQMGYDQVPTLLEPASEPNPTYTPTFRWTAVRGAQFYRLQYSTDFTFAAGVTQIDTRNTTYTPTNPLPNDVNYYWRVQTVSGSSLSNWSSVWSFRKQWYIKPVALTPLNGYPSVRHPFFSWTPVPGASYYFIEISDQTDLQGPHRIAENTSNPWYTPNRYWGELLTYYWKVTPYDKNNAKGVASDLYTYQSSYNMMAPMLVYPPYYYPPNMTLDPHEDRTVALPVFTWHRITGPHPDGDPEDGGYLYRVEVNIDPTFINDPVWTVDTENTNATPTSANPFRPTTGVDYYWRVCPLDTMGIDCLKNTADLPWWSQVWRTQIDIGQLQPTDTDATQLLRPVHGSEVVETMPLFEWQPLAGADNYEITISQDEGFTEILETVHVDYPAYAPTTSQGQRLLDRLNFGTFFWRVQAYSGGDPLGDVSDSWRFQVASQSQWKLTRAIGETANRLVIGTDNPADASDTNYELSDLYVSQDKDSFYIGFTANTSLTDMTYVLYLDTDHLDGSGADYDSQNYALTTIPAHRPEYAIYVYQNGGTFSAAQTVIYPWKDGAWGTPDVLGNLVNGMLTYDALNYVNLRIPNTVIGYSETNGSYTISLTSIRRSDGAVMDSVPSDPNIPGGNQISRFSSVSERMNQLHPANNIGGDPETFSSVPPFAWDYPVGGNGSSPWAGATMRAYLDASFTTQIAEYKLESNAPYYASSSHPWPKDFIGDNSYYWRVQPRYLAGIAYFGVWSQGGRFERLGFVPQNLQVSVTQATPTFSWEMAEGATSYDLQVDNDPNFGSREVDINTSQTSYTPTSTLGNGTYFWRVRIKRWENVTNEWSTSQSFTLSLPKPTGLTPDDPSASNVVSRAPTLCWFPILVLDDGEPVLAAYKYRVQITYNSAVLETIDTEQTCYTPTAGYSDGTYTWRVAMIDGNSRVGDYSPPATFTKQYPITDLVAPVNVPVLETPTFYWTPVDGASSYRLEISQFDTFLPIYESITTNNTRYTPSRIYTSPATYYWRVAIVDYSNKIGPFTDAQIILDPSNQPNKLFLPLTVH